MAVLVWTQQKKKRTITLLILVVEGCWAGFAKKCLKIRNPWTDENIGKAKNRAKQIR